MDEISVAFDSAFSEIASLGPQLVAAIVVFVLLWGLGRAIGGGLNRLLGASDNAGRHSKLLVRLVELAGALVGVVLALQLLGLTAVATSLLATGGFLAVVLGFAFREIGENLLAGIFLGISRSFEVGDLVESSGHVGEVRGIELRQVWLRAADGRDIFVPSAEIFRNALVNFTRDGLRRGDFVIGIDYADRILDARSLLAGVTRDVPGVLDDPAPAVRLSEFAPQYCELRIFFWVDLDGGAGLAETRSNVMGACLKALRDGGYRLSADVSTTITIEDEEEEPGR